MRACRRVVIASVALVLFACGGDGGDGDTNPSPVTLTISVTGPGAVELSGAVSGTCASSCDFSVTHGAALTLAPAPGAGARFDGFGGACSGTEACALRPAADTSVTATFSTEPVEPQRVFPTRYVATELTYANQEVIVEALDDDGNAVGCVGGSLVGSLMRPFLYDAAAGALVLLPPEDRSACANGLGGGTVAIRSVEGAYRYADGALQELGSLGGEVVTTADVNDSGWIVGTATLPDGRAHPFLHDGVAMRDLGTSAPETSAYGVAINSSGEVLASDGGLFTGGAWIPLSVPAGAYLADLSDGGLVVGGVDLGGMGSDGLVHDARTGLTTLVDAPDRMRFLSFYRVNGAGTRMLARMGDRAVSAREFVYGAGEFQWLGELLGRPDWYTSGADVNDRGQIAVRVVDDDESPPRARSFILTPE